MACTCCMLACRQASNQTYNITITTTTSSAVWSPPQAVSHPWHQEVFQSKLHLLYYLYTAAKFQAMAMRGSFGLPGTVWFTHTAQLPVYGCPSPMLITCKEQASGQPLMNNTKKSPVICSPLFFGVTLYMYLPFLLSCPIAHPSNVMLAYDYMCYTCDTLQKPSALMKKRKFIAPVCFKPWPFGGRLPVF